MIQSKIVLTMTNGEVFEKKQKPSEHPMSKAEIETLLNALFKKASHFLDCKDGRGKAYNLANVVTIEYIEGEETMDANKNNTLKVLEALKTVEFTETKESIRWVCEIDGKPYGSYMPNSEGVNIVDAVNAFMPQIAGTIEGVICGEPD